MTTEVLDAPAASQQGTVAPTPAAAPAPAETVATGTLATQAAGEQQAPQGQQPTPAADATPGTPEGDKGAAPAVPEKYEFTAPEGTSLDESVVAAYSDVARELQLPQEAAQKVIDKLLPALTASAQRQIDAFYEDIGGPPNSWKAKTDADPEFGGAKLQANLAVAERAMRYATPQLRELFNKTGLGDHPEMVRWKVRVGQLLSEDTFVGGKGDKAPVDPARLLYPSMKA